MANGAMPSRQENETPFLGIVVWDDDVSLASVEKKGSSEPPITPCRKVWKI